MATPVTTKTPARRVPSISSESGCERERKPLLTNGQPSTPDSASFTAEYDASLGDLAIVLRPLILDDEISPIEALPSPLLSGGDECSMATGHF